MRAIIFFIMAFCLWQTPSMAQAPIEAYAVEPKIQAAALSPDGSLLALANALESEQVIQIITLDGVKAKGAANISIDFARNSRQDILWLGWANADTLLANVRFIDAGNKGRPIGTNRLVAISSDGETLKDLGILYGGISLRGTSDRFNGSGILSLLPEEPDHILMGLGGHAATKLNIKTGHSSLVRRGARGISFYVPDLRGEVRVGHGEIRSGQYKLTIRDAEGGTWRDHSEYPGLMVDEKIVGFTENPSEMIVARYGASGTLEFQVYDLQQHRITKTLFSDPQYDAAALVYNGRLDKIIGVEYIADAPQTRYFKSEYLPGIEKIKQTSSGSNVSILATDNSQNKFVVRISSETSPGVIHLIETLNNQDSIIAFDYPDLNATQHGQVMPVKYAAADGQVIPGYLTFPVGVSRVEAKDLPFIVMPHGGPYSRDYADFDWLAQYLSAQGYGLLQMNFRGSEGYGQAFLEQGRKDWSLMRSDVQDGANWLVSEGLADLKRMCILGWSFGGHLAQMAAADTASPYVCAASINGVSNWSRMRIPKEDKEFWGAEDNYKKQVQLTQSKHVANVNIPIYVGHAKLDTIVPYGQSKRLASDLKKYKKEYVFKSFEAADHEIASLKNRRLLLESLTDFFDTHLH